MQTLDVISINLWQMLVSLLNLVILFLLVKKFFYKPVKKMIKAREDAIAAQYFKAEQTKSDAEAEKKEYDRKLSGAKEEAEGIIQSAVTLAKQREKEIIDGAKNEAGLVMRRAEESARLEMAKAQESIKSEIVDVSTLLTEKILEREINADDHKELVDSFIEEIGDGYDSKL